MARDPVCGMEVDSQSAFAQREHGGETFYFCSQKCVDTFDADPHRYGHPSTPEQHSTNGHSVRRHEHSNGKSPTSLNLAHLEVPVTGLKRYGGPSLEKAITVVPGVSRAIVNAKDSRVFVDYDPERSKVSDLLETIRAAGFTLGSQTMRLKVSGLYCAECVVRIEDSLKAVPGVVDATMNAATNEVKVEYTVAIGDLNRLSRAVEAAGPYKAARAAEASEPEMDKEAQAMEKEYRSLVRKWWFAAAIGLPTMILSYPSLFPGLRDWFPHGSSNQRILWLAMTTRLATAMTNHRIRWLELP